MRILPQDKNELVQWLFIAGSVVSIVAMAHQIKVNRLQLAELRKKNEEQHLSYLSTESRPVKVNPALHIRKKHDVFCLWQWYNHKMNF